MSTHLEQAKARIARVREELLQDKPPRQPDTPRISLRASGRPIVLKCDCCDLPFATIQRGVLMVNSRHHGDKHVNVIGLRDLIQMLRDLTEEAVV